MRLQKSSMLGFLFLTILAIIIPLTVVVSQQKQETREHAAGLTFPDPTNFNSPYGFSTINADSTLVSDDKQLGIHWTRYQLQEDQIDNGTGAINWAPLDTAVTLMNQNGIHILFDLYCFYQPGSKCFGGPYIPTVTEMTNYATQVATRYNGQNGHGYIDAFEIGNEEYMKQPPSVYGPLLKAGYQAIKAISPNVPVGIFGINFDNSGSITSVLSYLYQNGYGPYFDYVDYHYYAALGDPANPPAGVLSFNQSWQLFQNLDTHYGYPNKPLWITEIGYPSIPQPTNQNLSPQTQAQYMQYTLDQARLSGIVQKIFWQTIDYPHDVKYDIYPATGPLPAFTTYQNFIAQYRLWNNTPTPQPTFTPTPSQETSVTPTQSLSQMPSPTQTSGTSFFLTVCPHGLGNCGDNTTPSSGGNTNPLHTTRNITLNITDSSNNLVSGSPFSGQVTYLPSSLNYQGTITVPNLLSGQYLVNVKMDGFLGKQFPRVISVVQGQQVNLPEIFLTSGDINNDNQLDIEDYNILISCYGTNFTSSSCLAPATPQSPGADIDDEGLVDGVDYNLFLRELSVQHGG